MKILCSLVAAFLLTVTAKGEAIASVEYFYAKDGTLTGRAVNGKHQFYEYDRRGQLLAVKDTAGRDVERYTYDPAGNILSKYVNGVKTTYTYDKVNQLVSSTVNGKTTTCEYDAAGRLIREGNNTYKYGYPDKVMAVHENGKEIASFDYHIDGRIASARYGDRNEEFLRDGLALIHRSGNDFINEPYVTGGNPILSSKDGVMFNDMLGNTLNIGGKSVNMTAFGETAAPSAMFTGKPYIGELGYAFLFRNYRAEKGKWQTADPLGYPDGWNNLAYCNNWVIFAVDENGAWLNVVAGAIIGATFGGISTVIP